MGEAQVVLTDNLAPWIEGLKTKLVEIGYSQATITKSSSVWNTLLSYTKTHESQTFDAEYCKAFSEQWYGGCPENQYAASRTTVPLVQLLDFIRFGTVFRQKNHQKQDFTQGFKALFDGFLQSQEDRGLAKNSICSMRSRLHRLERFLLDIGVEQFNDMDIDVINKYVESLARLCSTTTTEIIRELGHLSDYAFNNGFHERSFAKSLPHVKRFYRQRLPHVFTTEEVQKLLAAVDRNNPKGKRDYAMLIMAAKLGLRVGDIRIMQISAIDWIKKTISIVQHKTGKFLELPLPEDVGWAIIDYMKNGRPICDSQTIFISHTKPYNGLSANVVNLVAGYMRIAGIETPQNKTCGLHTLRHSLASSMLQNGVPLPTISSVLGHADIHSTESYLRIDVTKLQLCPLEVDL